jgi:O-antigen ligase
LPLAQAGALVALAGGALLLLRWPWLIWPALGAALPVAASIGIGRVSLADVLLAGALGLWFIDGVRQRTLRIAHSPLLSLALLWVLAQCFALLGAIDLVEGVAEVVKWVEFALILAVAPTMLSGTQARWLVIGLLIGGAGQAALGLYQFVNQIGPDWFIVLGRFMRASGSFGQPNPYAGYLGLCLPVALSLAIWAWGQSWLATAERREGEAGAWRHRLLHLGPALFYSAVSAMLLAGLLASWSRGAWLGMAAGLITVVALRSRAALASSGVALLLVMIGLLFGSFQPQIMPQPVAERLVDLPAYFGLTDVLSQPVTDENFSVVERIAHWVAALRMWEQAPWFGIGPGNYAAVYPAVRLPRWEEALGHAHNIYLNVLAETGVFGLTAYLLLWGGAILWTWRQFRQAALRSYTGALAIGILGVLAHLSIHNLFDNLFVQGIYLHVALLFAALMSLATTGSAISGQVEVEESVQSVPQ